MPVVCDENIRKYVEDVYFGMDYALKKIPSQTVISVQQVTPDTEILIQTEQLSRPMIRKLLIQQILQNGSKLREIWDYSAVNREFLQNDSDFADLKKRIHLQVVPLKASEATVRDIQKKRSILQQEFDLGFCGTLTPWRKHFIQQLIRRGLSVRILGSTFGPSRDIVLNQCRAILNLHAGPEYQVFEQARCYAWLDAGIPVITEQSLDDDLRCTIVAERGDLEERIVEYFKETYPHRTNLL